MAQRSPYIYGQGVKLKRRWVATAITATGAQVHQDGTEQHIRRDIGARTWVRMSNSNEPSRCCRSHVTTPWSVLRYNTSPSGYRGNEQDPAPVSTIVSAWDESSGDSAERPLRAESTLTISTPRRHSPVASRWDLLALCQADTVAQTHAASLNST